MNNFQQFNQNANPNEQGTPNLGSENGQLQWILTAIEQLRVSSSSMHDKLDNHIQNINLKIDSNQNAVSERIVDKNKGIEDKLNHKFEVIELKLAAVQKSIDDNHSLACEKIESVKPVIFNKINDDQKISNRWTIGILITLAVAVVGLCIRVFGK
ncbi:hypothetical protein C9415_03670 [Kluyvera sp. Nf5]|nr:hypothetical protein C9415_03670 [Kluyvera sp. Nf5]